MSRRYNRTPLFDVICDCGWSKAKCLRDDIPARCPQCGGSIVEEARANSEKRRFIGWSDPGYVKCEGCGENTLKDPVCQSCLAKGVIPSDRQEQRRLEGVLAKHYGREVTLGSEEAKAFFARLPEKKTTKTKAAYERRLLAIKADLRAKAKRDEAHRRSKARKAIRSGAIYVDPMPCISCEGDATGVFGVCKKCRPIFEAWIDEAAQGKLRSEEAGYEGPRLNPSSFEDFAADIRFCEGCGRPTANRSGLCSACSSLGHRNTPRRNGPRPGEGEGDTLKIACPRCRAAAGRPCYSRTGATVPVCSARRERAALATQKNPHKTCPRCRSGVKDTAAECWKCGLIFDSGSGGSVFGRVARGSFGAARNRRGRRDLS